MRGGLAFSHSIGPFRRRGNRAMKMLEYIREVAHVHVFSAVAKEVMLLLFIGQVVYILHAYTKTIVIPQRLYVPT